MGVIVTQEISFCPTVRFIEVFESEIPVIVLVVAEFPVTVTLIFALTFLLFWLVTVMVQVPAPTAVTFPYASTVATAVFDEVQISPFKLSGAVVGVIVTHEISFCPTVKFMEVFESEIPVMVLVVAEFPPVTVTLIFALTFLLF